MDQNEMAKLFSDILIKLDAVSKKLDSMLNATNNNSDVVTENTNVMRNLEKSCFNLGNIMAQGISKNTSILTADKVVDGVLRALGK